jgi:hypothetical protein
MVERTFGDVVFITFDVFVFDVAVTTRLPDDPLFLANACGETRSKSTRTRMNRDIKASSIRKQTQRAEAGDEERKAGGQRCCVGTNGDALTANDLPEQVQQCAIIARAVMVTRRGNAARGANEFAHVRFGSKADMTAADRDVR